MGQNRLVMWLINNKRAQATTWVARREQIYLKSSEGYLREQMSSSSSMCIIMSHTNITQSYKPYSTLLTYQELTHIPNQIN